MFSFLDHHGLRSPRHAAFRHDVPRAFVRPQPRARYARRPSPQPIIETSTGNNSYRIAVKAPQCFAMQDAKAVAVGESLIELTGTIAQQPASSMLCTYVVNDRIPAFSAPNLRTHIGFVPAGTRVRGSAPSSAGWVALEDDDDVFVLYDQYDDSLINLGPEAVPPTRFARRIELPPDANLEQATTREEGGDEDAPALLLIEVPLRKRSSSLSSQMARRPSLAPPPKKSPEPPSASVIGQFKSTRATPTAAMHTSTPPTKRTAKQTTSTDTTTTNAPPRKASPFAGHASTAARPVLVEVEPNPSNVQRPEEVADQWVAIEGGSFVPALA